MNQAESCYEEGTLRGVKMKTVFYGAAIQGEGRRGDRQNVHSSFISAIKENGFKVATEHTSSTDKSEAMRLLEESIGPLPPKGAERTAYVRDKMIGFVEGDVSACVFELSAPSIGTGIEFAHAYLRPQLGLEEIPILVLYERDFWPNGLSSMVTGVVYGGKTKIIILEYDSYDEAKAKIGEFFSKI